MADPPRRVYWDACVFLAYIDDFEDRAHLLGTILDEAKQGQLELLTSVVSLVEVCFGADEQEERQLRPEVETKIQSLWLPPSPVRLVELYPLISDTARQMMRQAMTRVERLTPMDAIHLATARQLGVSVFHTYDQRLFKFSPRVGFPIIEPETAARRLPGT